MPEAIIPGYVPGVDNFYRFCYERQAVFHRRQMVELPAPWTDDPILRRYRFTNVFRELDKGNHYFQVGLDRAGWESFAEVLWYSCLYRQINRIETVERRPLPSPFATDAEIEAYLSGHSADMAAGHKVFTGRHLTVGLPRYRKMVHHLRDNWQDLATDLDCLLSAEDRDPDATAKDLFDYVRTVPSVGGFIGFQVYLDLIETEHTPWNEDAFVFLGPGSTKALTMLFGKSPRKALDEQARSLVSYQEMAWDSLGLPFHDVAPYPLTLKNIEHALCEYFRYAQLAVGKGRLSRYPGEGA